jgi:hypothetical protein
MGQGKPCSIILCLTDAPSDFVAACTAGAAYAAEAVAAPRA